MISYWTILLRLMMALVLGSVVGLEREQKERGAGMRTLALVTLGSALFTIAGAYGFLDLLNLGHNTLTLDPTRVASYIVAGVGFLGAGTIFMSREKEKVKGLTTAASIWVMAAIGIACGAGMLIEAATTTVLTLLVLIIFQYVERTLVPGSQTQAQHIRLDAGHVDGTLIANVYEICRQQSIAVDKLRMHQEQDGESIGLTCRVTSTRALANALDALHKLAGVRSVQVQEGDAVESFQLLSKRRKDDLTET